MAPNSPRHTWEPIHRTVLSLLKTYFANSTHENSLIFNFIFAEQLKREGFADGIPSSRLVAQLNEMQGGGTGSEYHRSVSSLSVHDLRSRYCIERGLIEDAAQALQIELRLKIRTVPASESFSLRLEHQPRRSDRHVGTARVASSSSELDYTPTRAQRAPRNTVSNLHRDPLSRTRHAAPMSNRRIQLDTTNPSLPRPQASPRPILNSFIQPAVDRHPPLLRITHDLHGNRGWRRPFLLFRTFQRSHGFVARKFLSGNITRIGDPPPLRSRLFRRIAIPHLFGDKTYQSPFLSLAENPCNALKRIQPDPNVAFAVFEYNRVEEDAKLRFRQSKDCGPYLTPAICKLHGIRNLPRSNPRQMYTGLGEFLAWGSIECPPVAILDAQQSISLRAVMSSTEHLGRDTGERIGRCLSMVGDRYKEIVAYKLIRSFKIPGFLGAPRSLQYQDFIEGVYDVVRGNRAASIFPNVDHSTLISPPGESSGRIIATEDMWRNDSDEDLPAPPRLRDQTTKSKAAGKVTTAIATDFDSASEYADDGWDLMDSEEDQPSDVPATYSSSGSSTARSTPVSSVLRPGTLNTFRQQIRHFDVDANNTPDIDFTDLPGPVTVEGSLHRPVDLTTSNDGVLQTIEVDEDEDDDNFMVTRSAQRFRRPYNITTRSQSGGPTEWSPFDMVDGGGTRRSRD